MTTLLEVFDAPSLASNCSKRTSSTVPLQSLALLNSVFARTRAAAFAQRLQKEEPDTGKRIVQAFRLAYGRPPGERELAAARRFQTEQQAVYEKEKDATQKVWTDFCQMLLASNGFLYVE